MSNYHGQDSIGMPRGATLRIEEGAGVLLHVWEGVIWLTEEGSLEDHMLQPGQWYRVAQGGAVLAHAFERSLVSLTPAAPGHAVRRIALTRAGAAEPTVLYQRRANTFIDALLALRDGWQALRVRPGAAWH